MAESWSKDTREIRKKASIINECAFLPEFFPEFPDRDNLSKKETDKYFKIFFKILKDKSITVYSTNKETNVLLAFFTYYWVKLNASPKLRLYSICYLCRDYFNEPPKNRDDEILKYYNTFFNAFFTKERISKLKKRYPGTIYSNIIKKNYELN